MSDFTLRVDVSIIVLRDDKVLLMQRPAHDKNFPLHWGIPGGGFEAGDTALESAGAREVREEVGVSIKNLRLAGNNYLAASNTLFVVFIADYDSGDIHIDPNEVTQAGWFGRNELPGRQFTPTTEELVRDALS